MSVKLMIDPASRRVAWFSPDGILPERVFVVDGPRQHLFSPATCEVLEFSGELPRELTAQNCWQYGVTASGRLERR